MMPRLMPEAPPRLDYEAAPYYNRTADEVGNYSFLHRRGWSPGQALMGFENLLSL